MLSRKKVWVMGSCGGLALPLFTCRPGKAGQTGRSCFPYGDLYDYVDPWPSRLCEARRCAISVPWLHGTLYCVWYAVLSLHAYP